MRVHTLHNVLGRTCECICMYKVCAHASVFVSLYTYVCVYLQGGQVDGVLGTVL